MSSDFCEPPGGHHICLRKLPLVKPQKEHFVHYTVFLQSKKLRKTKELIDEFVTFAHGEASCFSSLH